MSTNEITLFQDNGLDQIQQKIIEIGSGKEIDVIKLHAFNLEVLNIDPEPKYIKVNKLAGNSKYLPIGYVEIMLDTIFMGSWSLENFKWQVVTNEIVGTGELVLIHPITGREFRRVGSAAIQIQQTKGADVDNIGAKIKNALEKGFPKLKSEIVKNAAKSLGRRFGRDLNRSDNYDYDPNELEQLTDTEEVKDLDNKLDNCSDRNDIQVLWNTLSPVIKTRPEVIGRFTKRKLSLKQNA